MVEVAITLVERPEWVRGPASVEGNEIVLDEDRTERYSLPDARSDGADGVRPGRNGVSRIGP